VFFNKQSYPQGMVGACQVSDDLQNKMGNLLSFLEQVTIVTYWL